MTRDVSPVTLPEGANVTPMHPSSQAPSPKGIMSQTFAIYNPKVRRFSLEMAECLESSDEESEYSNSFI